MQVQRPRCKKCTCADACIYICVHGDVCIMFLCMFIYIYVPVSMAIHPRRTATCPATSYAGASASSVEVSPSFPERPCHPFRFSQQVVWNRYLCVYTCISVYLVFNMQMKLHRCSCTGHTHTHINYRTWRLPDGLRLHTKSPLLSGAQMGQKKMPKNAIHNSQ